MIKDKRGVSVVIGYILLVSIAIIVSILVYQWIRTYVPSETLECQEGVSVSLREYSYDCDLDQLNLTLRNSGRFNLAGYFIKASNSSSQLIPTIDLSNYTENGDETTGAVLESSIGQNNVVTPGNNMIDLFDLFGSGIGDILSLEIVPVRYENIDNRIYFVSCSDGRTTEDISCGVGTGSGGEGEGEGEGEGGSESIVLFYGFESGLQGWSVSNSPGGNPDSNRYEGLSYVTDDPEGPVGQGDWSLHIQDDNNPNSIISQEFDFSGNSSIQISWYAQYDGLEDSDCVELFVDEESQGTWGLSGCDNNYEGVSEWDSDPDVTVTNGQGNIDFDDGDTEIRFEGEMVNEKDAADIYLDGIRITATPS